MDVCDEVSQVLEHSGSSRTRIGKLERRRDLLAQFQRAGGPKRAGSLRRHLQAPKPTPPLTQGASSSASRAQFHVIPIPSAKTRALEVRIQGVPSTNSDALEVPNRHLVHSYYKSCALEVANQRLMQPTSSSDEYSSLFKYLACNQIILPFSSLIDHHVQGHLGHQGTSTNMCLGQFSRKLLKRGLKDEVLSKKGSYFSKS